MEDHCDLEALIANAGRLTPKRFCSVVYEKREELLRNRELIRLESDLDLDMEACPAFDLSALKEILLELEMNKSWEEAQRRYT